MTSRHYRLISHHLCPYVQRAAIVLDEKGIPYERENVDLANKPHWFLALSPLGKVPVLVVDAETILFESAVITEYLDEVTGGGLQSSDALGKAHEKSWVEFASATLAAIYRLYSAPDQRTFDEARIDLVGKWRLLEDKLAAGPWFAGERFSLVDAAFGPVFRYFDVLERLTNVDFFDKVPRVRAWRDRLSGRHSVRNAVAADYPQRLLRFFADRDSVVGSLARDSLGLTPEAVA